MNNKIRNIIISSSCIVFGLLGLKLIKKNIDNKKITKEDTYTPNRNYIEIGRAVLEDNEIVIKDEKVKKIAV